ncbi:glycosyltransferase family 2 protein [Empedobacter falsenii]
MQQPLISVIVPCYNQAQYMDECLQSVLEQTYTNWECIIVNDGSPDNTEDIALDWIKKDSRFKYIKKENGGLSSARNAGIKKANGEWILPLDCDDKIGNRYLELASKEFDKHYTIIYCEAEKFGYINGKWILPQFTLQNLATTNIIFCSFFYKKEMFDLIGGYDENMKEGLEDWEFVIKLIKKGKNILKLDYTGFYYRTKESSMITDITIGNKIPIFKYIENKHLDFFHEHLGPIHLLNGKALIIEKYEQEIAKMKIILNSKRYKIVDKLLSLIGK